MRVANKHWTAADIELGITAMSCRSASNPFRFYGFGNIFIMNCLQAMFALGPQMVAIGSVADITFEPYILIQKNQCRFGIGH